AAVGIKRALDSAIGLPSRSTRALRMLALLMPADVSSSFMLPLLADGMTAERSQNGTTGFSQPESYAFLNLLKHSKLELVASCAPLSAPGGGEDLGGCDREQQERFPRGFIP